MSEFLVSVCLITYNHEKYIREAIQGILNQKVNFSWEFIIADDFSTDGTREIISEYHKAYPHLIKLIIRDKNVGAGNNFLELIKSAKGKYIAYIEGDDYWIDSNKLQKQCDFLEANTDCSICFHRVYEIADTNKKRKIVDLVFPNTLEKIKYSIEDLARNNFIPSLSVFFLNGLFDNFPAWYLNCPAGDYALHMLNAKKGKIGFIPEFMGVYRRHVNGSWGLKENKYQLEKLLITVDCLMEEFSESDNIQKILNYQYAKYCAQIAEIEFNTGNEKEYLNILKNGFSRSQPFMDDYLSNIQKKSKDLYASKEYKIGWALKHPKFLLKKLTSLVKPGK